MSSSSSANLSSDDLVTALCATLKQGSGCAVTQVHVRSMAVADALATSFGKLGFAGRGNGLEDDPNVSKQPGEHGNGKGID